MKIIKSTLKGLILNVCPSLYHLYVAFILRKAFKDRYFSFQSRVCKILFPDSPPEVLLGPFVGMKYFNAVFFSSATSRWLGTYELELHEVIEEAIREDYPQIFDIGCAEGYYVVGLARRCTNSMIYARDGDPWSRAQCSRLCKLNGVQNRVKVGGLITRKNWKNFWAQRTWLSVTLRDLRLNFLIQSSVLEWEGVISLWKPMIGPEALQSWTH